MDENVKLMWNKVESDYQRRLDLIPNLVSTVKGAANFEKETLTGIVEARAKATSVQISSDNLTPEKLAEFQRAQAGVSSSLGRLLAVAENYPDLKATQNFQDLQKQLEGTENRIKVSRNDFNDAIQKYNLAVRRFPGNILAGIFNFHVKEGFKADEGAEKVPEVKF
jgi:LemA protein